MTHARLRFRSVLSGLQLKTKKKKHINVCDTWQFQELIRNDLLKAPLNWRHFPDRIGVKNLGSEERGKPKYSVKLSKQRRKPTQNGPTYGVEVGTWTQATHMGGESSHKGAIPAPSVC